MVSHHDMVGIGIQSLLKREREVPSDKYRDPRWLRLRDQIISRDGRKCTMCGSQHILQVHHQKYIGDELWDTPKEFLVTLCKKCHEAVHNI